MFLTYICYDLMVGFIFRIELEMGKASSVFMIGFVFRGL